MSSRFMDSVVLLYTYHKYGKRIEVYSSGAGGELAVWTGVFGQ